MAHIVFTHHAQSQLHERNIDEIEVRNLILSPDQILHEEDRIVYQKIIRKFNKIYLLRVITILVDDKIKILTVYRTNKISKYQLL